MLLVLIGSVTDLAEAMKEHCTRQAVAGLTLVEDVAARLRSDAGLVEKDWHVVRTIGVLAALNQGDVKPAFGGDTSLSKGWGLIERFSEDIDFKVAIPPAAIRSKDRNLRRGYREQLLNAMQAAGSMNARCAHDRMR